tara:strand:+ start:29 stop:247 length:219 start_codon:yes stop_codon:yes gene_type:complete
MCFGGAPSMPAPPAPPPPPPKPPTRADPTVRRAREQEEKRARNLAGSKSTIAIGPQGLLTPESTGTTFLGGA